MPEPHCWDATAGKDGLILPSIFLGGKAVNWTLCLVPAFSRLAEDSQFGQLAGAKGLVCGCGIWPNELG